MIYYTGLCIISRDPENKNPQERQDTNSWNIGQSSFLPGVAALEAMTGKKENALSPRYEDMLRSPVGGKLISKIIRVVLTEAEKSQLYCQRSMNTAMSMPRIRNGSETEPSSFARGWIWLGSNKEYQPKLPLLLPSFSMS